MSGTKSSAKAFLVFILLALPCCKDLGVDPPVAFSADRIMEAVFRHMFVNNYSGQQ